MRCLPGLELVFRDEIPLCTEPGCARVPPEGSGDPYCGLIKPGQHNHCSIVLFLAAVWYFQILSFSGRLFQSDSLHVSLRYVGGPLIIIQTRN